MISLFCIMNFNDKSSFMFLHKQRLSGAKENRRPKKYSKFDKIKKSIKFKDENMFKEV